MQLRTLGRSTLQVPPLCLGGNVFGWTADEATSFSILDAAVEAGLNFIDTADVYSVWIPGHRGGESETVIGNWLKRSSSRYASNTVSAWSPILRWLRDFSRASIGPNRILPRARAAPR